MRAEQLMQRDELIGDTRRIILILLDVPCAVLDDLHVVFDDRQGLRTKQGHQQV